MAKIQYCTCRINLSGQNCHIVSFDQYKPVTWPEVQVLMQLHGEENVMDVMPISIAEVNPALEKERLRQLYGFRVVESVFPGRAFRMELMMTGDDQLPTYVEGQAPRNGNGPKPGDDDDDDGTDDEVAKNLAAAAAPVFKPGKQRPPAEPAKEA
jgi:hypothetical protein